MKNKYILRHKGDEIDIERDGEKIATLDPTSYEKSDVGVEILVEEGFDRDDAEALAVVMERDWRMVDETIEEDDIR